VLLNAGYRVITYDRRGFGNSSQPSSGYDYDTFAADLNTPMTKRLAKYRVGWLQWGQVKSRAILASMAQNGAKAVLMAPVPPILLKTNDNPEGVDQSVFDGIMKAIVDRPAYFLNFKAFFNVDVLLRGLAKAIQASWNVAVGSSAKGTWIVYRPGSPIFAMICRIDVPTLIIHGDADRICRLSPPQQARS